MPLSGSSGYRFEPPRLFSLLHRYLSIRLDGEHGENYESPGIERHLHSRLHGCQKAGRNWRIVREKTFWRDNGTVKRQMGCIANTSFNELGCRLYFINEFPFYSMIFFKRHKKKSHRSQIWSNKKFFSGQTKSY